MSETIFLKADDGKQIFIRYWIADKPRAVLQIVHGMNEHSARYDEFAQYLNAANITVYATDHRGHGKTAGHPDAVGYIGENGFQGMVEDEEMVHQYILSKHDPALPHYLMGHSMGSFVTQRYIQLYGASIDGAIIMGSCGYNGLVKVGRPLAALVEKINHDKRSKFVESLVFATYNKKTTKQTPYDWLAADETVVQEFMKDPYCAKTFPPSFYKQFLQWLEDIFIPAEVAKVPKDLPLFLCAGMDDPVGLYGKGMYKLYRQYEQLGIKDLDMVLYEKSRHEILNDIEKTKVMEDILNWLEKELEILTNNTQ